MDLVVHNQTEWFHLQKPIRKQEQNIFDLDNSVRNVVRPCLANLGRQVGNDEALLKEGLVPDDRADDWAATTAKLVLQLEATSLKLIEDGLFLRVVSIWFA